MNSLLQAKSKLTILIWKLKLNHFIISFICTKKNELVSKICLTTLWASFYAVKNYYNWTTEIFSTNCICFQNHQRGLTSVFSRLSELKGAQMDLTDIVLYTCIRFNFSNAFMLEHLNGSLSGMKHTKSDVAVVHHMRSYAFCLLVHRSHVCCSKNFCGFVIIICCISNKYFFMMNEHIYWIHASNYYNAALIQRFYHALY